jgi:hypothetical protein
MQTPAYALLELSPSPSRGFATLPISFVNYDTSGGDGRRHVSSLVSIATINLCPIVPQVSEINNDIWFLFPQMSSYPRPILDYALRHLIAFHS